MTEELGRIELDAMRKAAGITVVNLSLQDPISGTNYPHFVVYRDNIYDSESWTPEDAERLADELAMELAAQGAIGAAVEAEV